MAEQTLSQVLPVAVPLFAVKPPQQKHRVKQLCTEVKEAAASTGFSRCSLIDQFVPASSALSLRNYTLSRDL